MQQLLVIRFIVVIVLSLETIPLLFSTTDQLNQDETIITLEKT